MVRSFAPADRVRVIPPGIDLDAWTDRAEPVPEDLPDRYLLYAGRIAPNKGLSGLFSALALIPPSERIPLVLMGRDWGERGRLEATARHLGIATDLLWLGHVDSAPSYRAVFRRAAVFVLPSEWEAFGLVLLEAMAAGLPIVATAVGGVPEVLDAGKVGRLVPYGDPAALGEAIRSVLADPAAADRWRNSGLERVRSFTWERAVAAHRALYRELVGTPSGGAEVTA